MSRLMRARLVGWCVAFVCAGCFALTVSLATRSTQKNSTRWPVDVRVVSVASLSGLTNAFLELERPFTVRLERAGLTEYAIVSRYTHSGIRTFEVYCYEKIENEAWYLRDLVLLHFSDSMNVTVSVSNQTITLIHDGVAVCTLFPLADQYSRQRAARLERSNAGIDTNDYIYLRSLSEQ